MTYSYVRRNIKKRNGSNRELIIPSEDLKIRQKEILSVLETKLPDSHCHGFVKNKSILTHAKTHLGSNVSIHLDIKDFFPSITYPRVRGLFRLLGLPLDWTELCCFENRLPQGSPCSPYIANLVAKSLDSRLAYLAESYACRYSRYADDIVISVSRPGGNDQLKDLVGYQINQAKKIICDEDFKINTQKTKIKYGPYRIITGILVGPVYLEAPETIWKQYRQAFETGDKDKIKGIKSFITMVANANVKND